MLVWSAVIRDKLLENHSSAVVSPNTVRRAIESTPLGKLVINIKEKNFSFENNVYTHVEEQLIAGVFSISGNFYSSSFFFYCVVWASVRWTKHSLRQIFCGWGLVDIFFLCMEDLWEFSFKKYLEDQSYSAVLSQNQLPIISIYGKLNIMQIIGVTSFYLISVIYPFFYSVWNFGKTNMISTK